MSRAWFALAVFAVLGLFYVGTGMRGGPVVGAAQGQEAATQPAVQLKLTWETLGSRSRTKIPGGWLVETSQSGGNGDGLGLTFVPDPEHKWQQLAVIA